MASAGDKRKAEEEAAGGSEKRVAGGGRKVTALFADDLRVVGGLGGALSAPGEKVDLVLIDRSGSMSGSVETIEALAAAHGYGAPIAVSFALSNTATMRPD